MKRLLYFLIPAIALGTLITWRFVQNKHQQELQTQAANARKNAPPLVRVAPAVVRDILHEFVGVADVQSPFDVPIGAKVTGRLDYLQVRIGDPVKQGEVLARIDPSEVQAAVNQQQAAVAEAQYRLTQAQLTTNPTNVSVITQINQQQAGVTTAEANLNQTRQNYVSQVASAQSAVTDAQGRVDSAKSAINNAQAAVDSAQADLNDVTVRYNRTYDLYKQGFTAAQDVDDAKAQVLVEQSAVRGAKAQLASAQGALSSAQAELRSAQEQVRIVTTTSQANIASAQASVKQARAGLAYARSNVVQRPAYQANLDALRADVAANQAELRNLQAQLSDTILRSPVTGFVTARNVDPGVIISAGQPIVTIQVLRQVFVTTSVPESVRGDIQNGMQTRVDFDALPGRIFYGKVTQVNNAADPQTRLFLVQATLDNSQDLIKPGMFCRMTLVIGRTPHAIVVPHEAIQQGPNGPMVVVVDNNSVAHQHAVQTGDQDVTGIAITKGVQAGENVVILSGQTIRDGQKVRMDNQTMQVAGQPTILNTGGGAPISTGQPTGGGAAAPTYGTPTAPGTASANNTIPASTLPNTPTTSVPTPTITAPVLPSTTNTAGQGVQSPAYGTSSFAGPPAAPSSSTSSSSIFAPSTSTTTSGAGSAVGNSLYGGSTAPTAPTIEPSAGTATTGAGTGATTGGTTGSSGTTGTSGGAAAGTGH
jgi:RND family efflux transporter MFP subunit